ncbi:unnamed protein product, partial [marine sediment metagenome]
MDVELTETGRDYLQTRSRRAKSAHCMLTGGTCPHDIIIKSNSFFIAEPYDKNREPREQAIIEAITGFPYYIADKDIMNIAITCKVCREIQS